MNYLAKKSFALLLPFLFYSTISLANDADNSAEAIEKNEIALCNEKTTSLDHTDLVFTDENIVVCNSVNPYSNFDDNKELKKSRNYLEKITERKSNIHNPDDDKHYFHMIGDKHTYIKGQPAQIYPIMAGRTLDNEKSTISKKNIEKIMIFIEESLPTFFKAKKSLEEGINLDENSLKQIKNITKTKLIDNINLAGVNSIKHQYCIGGIVVFTLDNFKNLIFKAYFEEEKTLSRFLNSIIARTTINIYDLGHHLVVPNVRMMKIDSSPKPIFLLIEEKIDVKRCLENDNYIDKKKYFTNIIPSIVKFICKTGVGDLTPRNIPLHINKNKQETGAKIAFIDMEHTSSPYASLCSLLWTLPSKELMKLAVNEAKKYLPWNEKFDDAIKEIINSNERKLKYTASILEIYKKRKIKGGEFIEIKMDELNPKDADESIIFNTLIEVINNNLEKRSTFCADSLLQTRLIYKDSLYRKTEFRLFREHGWDDDKIDKTFDFENMINKLQEIGIVLSKNDDSLLL